MKYNCQRWKHTWIGLPFVDGELWVIHNLIYKNNAAYQIAKDLVNKCFSQRTRAKPERTSCIDGQCFGTIHNLVSKCRMADESINKHRNLYIDNK